MDNNDLTVADLNNNPSKGASLINLDLHRGLKITGDFVSDTPITDDLQDEESKLIAKSSFKDTYDWTPIKDLEIRSKKVDIRGGILFKTPFKVVNSHATCQQCLYAFEIDTYGRGCVHNCVYCYAKAQLTVHGYWNNPFPVPLNINEIHNVFYTVFETDKTSKWRPILEKRIPLRIGSMSDSFMWMDQKYKVTQHLLKILKHYNYPYVIFTRSDLVATDEYMSLIDPKLTSIQFSISSTNDEMNKKIEPGAPSAKRRLAAIKKISEAGYWTTIRINPVFPIHPDGYFTDANFQKTDETPKFDYFSFDMVDEMAASGVKSILAGFGRFSTYSLTQLEKATGFGLRNFYTDEVRKSKRDFHFSDNEIRYYYEQIKKRCQQSNVQFTTCYIGNGENHFWKDQDLWSNKKDCCNIKDRVPAFHTNSRDIPFETRLKFTAHKSQLPVSEESLHRPLGDGPSL
ncbi:SPL family radical SAM protein [Bdellovibrio bacteriovorus]|uniref:Putative DNA repair photolyase n=1 Tax=Bdellovibrio bacteriovorus str. Tiberius TaxID=1069642 RepID=K7ZDY1_BDEBC|nr:radical SAM protein [Bdellovibrio bacteriovorus]AFX99941.1 putative DNA repair photolyase [Bdellovibrio bacteriovorus str. Tiberius]